MFRRFFTKIPFPTVTTKPAMKILISVLLASSCIYAAGNEAGRAKPHEETLSSKDHFVEGEHSSDYDHDAFLGDMKDEYEDLPPAEAKKRLKVLVKKVDSNSDGFVTEEELTKWVRDVFSKRLIEGVDVEMKEKDADGDGKISWNEYTKSSFGPEELEEADDEVTSVLKRDERRFNTADEDKDGALNMEEFVQFMHPESSSKMGDIHVLETIEGSFVFSKNS